MEQIQAGQEVVQVTQVTSLALSSKKVKVKRRWQTWHYLIPIFSGFWIVFGVILIASNFLFLAFSALAVVAVMSILVIALAWAFENNI